VPTETANSVSNHPFQRVDRPAPSPNSAPPCS
jgi:hypothetical protein